MAITRVAIDGGLMGIGTSRDPVCTLRQQGEVTSNGVMRIRRRGILHFNGTLGKKKVVWEGKEGGRGMAVPMAGDVHRDRERKRVSGVERRT
jgi:hypothetical protein